MKTSDFKNKWNDFKGQNGYLQRLDPNHPMDFFIGISEKGFDELALFTDVEPAKLTSSKALEVKKSIRKDGRWATQIYLLENENQDIFARLCLDLVECSQKCKTEAQGLSDVTRRYLAWQKLFSKLKETLSISVLKGLIGEIDFAKSLINNGLSKDDAISSWRGPDGDDRDFTIFSTWVENKAISTGKSYVSISSLNQLESDEQGYVSVVHIDETSATDSHGVNVQEYINEFRALLSDAPAASTLFEQKLVSIGYIDKKAYEDIFFTIGDRSFYLVNDSFPKLTTNSVQPEIIEATYNLSIVGIEAWKVEEYEVWNYMNTVKTI